MDLEPYSKPLGVALNMSIQACHLLTITYNHGIAETLLLLLDAKTRHMVKLKTSMLGDLRRKVIKSRL